MVFEALNLDLSSVPWLALFIIYKALKRGSLNSDNELRWKNPNERFSVQVQIDLNLPLPVSSSSNLRLTGNFLSKADLPGKQMCVKFSLKIVPILQGSYNGCILKSFLRLNNSRLRDI